MATRRVVKRGNIQTMEPTAQSTLIHKAKNLGNKGLANSQGSTVVIYDHLFLPQGLLPLNTEFRFFESAASRTFPLTNLAEGRLPVATGFILERMWFTLMTIDNATGAVVFETTFAAAGIPGMYKADFSFFNANNRVIKPTPLTKQNPAFNWRSNSAVNEVIHLDTDISIQPLIEFVCSLKTPALTVPVFTGQTAYLGCYGEGAGGILNPRANF